MKIGFVGAGKVGSALGLYFVNHGLEVVGYCSRSLLSAKKAADLTGSAFFESIRALAEPSDVVFITTPDQALSDIDAQVSVLLRSGEILGKKVWIHTSGAFPSDCLSKIKAMGQPVGSLHPLQSFADPVVGSELLEETFFTIEGTPDAMDVMRALLCKTGGTYDEIFSEQKALYHAGACVISNYLVTLMESGMRLMEASGMKRETLFRAVSPLISGTLKNIAKKGPVEALTGPLVRGDYDTVALHLKAMKESLPGEVDLYLALAWKTVSMIEGIRLDSEQVRKFQTLLRGSDKHEQ